MARGCLVYSYESQLLELWHGGLSRLIRRLSTVTSFRRHFF